MRYRREDVLEDGDVGATGARAGWTCVHRAALRDSRCMSQCASLQSSPGYGGIMATLWVSMDARDALQPSRPSE